MRILIAAGKSGGHIYPAVALAQELKNCAADVLLVLPRTSPQNNLPVEPVQVQYIAAGHLSLQLNKKTITGFYFCLSGAWESLRIILKFKPDAVVGFGSLNTLALIFWAWLFRIKTIIHEQNVICGRANRLLAKFVDRVAVSFKQTAGSLSIAKEKIIVTGNPLRRNLQRLEKKAALDFFGFARNKFTVLVTGGSQGSHKLNTACFEALVDYPAKDNLQVIHICGNRDYGQLKGGYGHLPYRLFEFLPQMQYAYSASDLIICRSGATTIAELRRFGVPAILVPYPFAYAHQSANARILEEIGAALIIPDQELTAKIIKEKLTEFLKDPQALINMRQAYARLPEPDAAQLLAKEVLSSCV